jgi:hypothetical protein
VGYRNTLAIMFAFMAVCIFGAYGSVRSYWSLLSWTLWVGFGSGVYGLFTMYLPPLFPTLLRTTGAGFCYNIGRLASAAGTVLFVYVSVDLRIALFAVGFLFVAAMLAALLMPQMYDEVGDSPSHGSGDS